MKILAIETSCDDTGIAVLDVQKDGRFKVLSNIVSSQIEVHKKYGGVYPMMAKREHQKNLVPTLTTALKESKLLKTTPPPKWTTVNFSGVGEILEREQDLKKKLIPFLKKYAKPDIDLIAVTNGPGLEPCLWVGVNFARALSSFWNLPIIDVNHIKAHIFVNTLNNGKNIEELKPGEFPLLALVVSGGHTQLVLMKKPGQYEILGETRDDAAGECFDKCAKILGLSYPGGPVISKMAAAQIKSGRASPVDGKDSIILPRPMINTKDYDFSFSGLKTAVLYADKKVETKNKKYKQQMASEVQQAIIDVLIKKTIKAAKDYNIKTLILGGGVTANKELRNQMQKKLADELPNAKFVVPPASLSTDNGLMTAITGYFKAKQNKFSDWRTLEADSNLRIA